MVSPSRPASATREPVNAVFEALLEVRFTTTLTSDLVVGRLAGQWPNATIIRSPFADIPLPIRRQDPNLRHQPTLELKVGQTRVIKLGEQVISFHCVGGSYPGWAKLSAEFEGVVKFLAKSLPGFKAVRLGLRYVNLFTIAHGVKVVSDLPVTVEIGKRSLERFNLVYRLKKANDLELQSNVASAEFLLQTPSPDVTAIADFDAYTPGNHTASTPSSVMKWIDRAHTAIKAEFAQLQLVT